MGVRWRIILCGDCSVRWRCREDAGQCGFAVFGDTGGARGVGDNRGRGSLRRNRFRDGVVTREELLGPKSWLQAG